MRTRKLSQPVAFSALMVLTIVGTIGFSKIQGVEAAVMSQPKMLSILKMEQYRRPEQLRDPSLALRLSHQRQSGLIVLFSAGDELGRHFERILSNPGVESCLQVIPYLRLDESRTDARAFMDRHNINGGSVILILDVDGSEIYRMTSREGLPELSLHLQKLLVTKDGNPI